MSSINHPAYYQRGERKECIVEMQERFGTYVTIIFDLTNVYKYLYRAGAKENIPEETDIAKAKWYYAHAMSLYKDNIRLNDKEYKLLNWIRRELKKYD